MGIRAEQINIKSGLFESDGGDLALVDGGLAATKLNLGNGLADSAGVLKIASAVAGDGLTIASQVLSVNVDDSSIETSLDTLQVKAAGITNAMLAGSIANAKLSNSTISGVALGGTLGELSVGNGLSMTAYNGSSAISDLTIDLDGATLTVGAAGIKITNNGVDTGQLAAGAVRANEADLTDTWSFTGGILRAAEPSGTTDVTTKNYVDNLINGLKWKESVQVASTANIDLGVASNPGAIDGYSLINGDRILLKNQSTGSGNGVYSAVDATDPTTWVRSDDMNTAAEIENAMFLIEEGTVNGDVGFVCSTDGTITLDTTALSFVQATTAGSYSGGDGLDLSGLVFSVKVDDSSIQINADALRVKASGITNAMLAGSITAEKINKGVGLTDNAGNLELASGVAGAGLAIASQVLSVNVDDSSIEISSDTLQVKAAGVTNAMLAGSIANAKLSNSTISGVALGGTLAALSAGQGLAIASAYDGSGTQTMDLNLDGSTLSKSASGVKVSNQGIAAAQLAISNGFGTLVSDVALNGAWDLGANDIVATSIADFTPSLNNGVSAVFLNGVKVRLDPSKGDSAPGAGYDVKVQNALTVSSANLALRFASGLSVIAGDEVEVTLIG